jgi:diphthine synthase
MTKITKPQSHKATIKKNGFFLIGTGMTKNSLSVEALEILKSCDSIYLENYTVNFPYPIQDLEKNYKIKIQELSREKVENESILKESKNSEIALLVYGDALSATTHIQLILSAKKQSIPYKVYHNASILTTVAETGLSLYKFGKTTSMPNWYEHTNKPTSFINYIKQNSLIDAHTLILTDIGLDIKNAIKQLQESAESEKFNLPEKIIAISNAGTPQQKIFYDTPENLTALQHTTCNLQPETPCISMPFCLIIPTKLHFLEEEALKELKE